LRHHLSAGKKTEGERTTRSADYVGGKGLIARRPNAAGLNVMLTVQLATDTLRTVTCTVVNVCRRRFSVGRRWRESLTQAQMKNQPKELTI
jgi:hypothetical protein